MSFAQKIAEKISRTDFSNCEATVIGYGNMGREFVKALQVLKIRKICVCSLSRELLLPLQDFGNITAVAGGYKRLKRKPAQNELAIIAIPIADLIPAAQHLRELDYRNFLIEKPISLWGKEIRKFCKIFADANITAVSGYNRAAYPSLLELKHLAEGDGGITSCTYAFTEFTNRIDPKAYTKEEARRWGIANSLHVMSMAHSLIGMPKDWNSHRGADSAVSWHPAGSVFVGSGISDRGIAFAYHADWGSTGRWSVEVHTKAASYRLCPLEQLSVRYSFKEGWKDIPVTSLAPDVKAGFVEQVASLLNKEIGREIPLIALEEACRLTEFAEDVFGYEDGN